MYYVSRQLLPVGLGGKLFIENSMIGWLLKDGKVLLDCTEQAMLCSPLPVVSLLRPTRC